MRTGNLAGPGTSSPTDRVPERGLSSAQAASRLTACGLNVLPAPRPVPLWRRVVAQLRDPLVLVLLAAAVLTTATGDWTDASVIMLVIVVNTSAGVIQEVKADHAISALTQLAAPEARVVRDGGQRQIPAAEVVPGDLLVLAEGDIVPADAQVSEAAALLVDESALTGESVPVDKSPGTGPGLAADVVSAGTVVVRGRGQAVVTATGTASAMGRVAALMTARSALTPLQHRMIGVGRALAVAAVGLCAIVLALGLARGQSAELMVITAISLVVAAVPESLPAVVTLALALGGTADDRPQHAHPPAARGRDPGLGDRPWHRQDRHPYRGVYGRPAAVDTRRRGGDQRRRRRPAGRAGELADHGFRVLALAAADRPAIPAADDAERALRLLGLVGIVDPPRRSAADAIAACQRAGITPVLITGDHPATARAPPRPPAESVLGAGDSASTPYQGCRALPPRESRSGWRREPT